MVNGFCQGTIGVFGFSILFFTSDPLLPMVFHISTIGIGGFSNVFFTLEPLPSKVFHWSQFIFYIFWLWMTGMGE